MLKALKRIIAVIIPTPDIIPLPASDNMYLLLSFVKIEFNRIFIDSNISNGKERTICSHSANTPDTFMVGADC